MKTRSLKKMILTALLGAFILSAQAQIQVPQASPAATVSQSIGLAKATVEYSRPALKGRKMFGTQVPYGKVWRTGANKVTNLILSDEMTLNGQKVPAGTYGLFTIPNPNEWTIILSKDANIWGAYTYNAANDVMRFSVKAQKLARPEEYLTIAFTDFSASEASLEIRWENTVVKFPIRHDADAKIMADIQAKMAGATVSAGTYSAAANYYFDTNRDLKQAFEWANKVVEQDQKYYTYYLRAKIAAKIGNCEVATADAQKGLAMGKEAGDDAYILNHQTLLKQCAGK
jgi:hypothetical protein